jgi:hypothetical protein
MGLMSPPNLKRIRSKMSERLSHSRSHMQARKRTHVPINKQTVNHARARTRVLARVPAVRDYKCVDHVTCGHM